MKKISIKTIITLIVILTALIFINCSSRNTQSKAENNPAEINLAHADFTQSSDRNNPAENPQAPVVYMTTSISPEGLLNVYKALGLTAAGNVAVKISTGEPGNKHFLAPSLIKNLVQLVKGTIVECNTVYGGRRASTAAHYEVAREHGFTAIAPVVILDERADISLPVTGGKHLKENFVGARFNDFNFHIILSHFKGHQMGGFGGALKNLSIGYASSAGKSWIHSGGKSKTRPWGGAQNDFLESMAEAAKTVVDANRGRILYINVMNHLSVDCDCSGNPAAPTMADIGILASLDPVALDQACVDLVFAAQDGRDLIQRIESRNGLLTIEHAQLIGLGSKTYRLQSID
ncbi:MAG: DUF362 domain-containing protein [Treponema sp.]|nr:DUF362 domain-containing protein [Treponema sp.]MCL2252050.1 DUF362 domain-containing protein [Treponema sp.]